MIKHYIDGKVKTKADAETHCKHCKDGMIFGNEKDLKTHQYEGNTHEYICGAPECNTKYIRVSVPNDKLVGSSCEGCPSLTNGGLKCANTDERYLCIGSTMEHTFKLFTEVKEVSIELMNKRELYQQTKKCPGHMWITSMPFKTGEGKFTIDTCRICQQAKVSHNGQIYQDKLMKIVGFLAGRGIDVAKQEKEKIEQFSSLGTEVLPETKIDIADLFSTQTQAMPKLNFVTDMPILNFKK